MRAPRVLPLLLAPSLAACAAFRSVEPDRDAELVQPAAVGTSIVACGQRFDIGAPVVLWTDPGGYDATSTEYRFGRPRRGPEVPEPGSPRYKPGRIDRASGRVLVQPGSQDLLALQRVVDQFVIHYDVCGTSKKCFEVLHDRRGLSVQFLLDVDGTIYQTLDLRDTAWHAAKANTRSIGIEIANIGAYPERDAAGRKTLARWYERDDFGTRLVLPDESGVRVPGFVGRPARPEPVRGRVQGEVRVQYDFTPEQYASLVKLTAGLCRVFQRIAPDAPRDASGRVSTSVLSDEDWRAFEGILGHYHVSSAKQDPGPAFDWDRFLARVRTRLAATEL